MEVGTGVAVWKYDGGDIIYSYGHGIVGQSLMGIKYISYVHLGV